tara:strand:+ start:404 stop:934 length:531 start_codon:yes stop_codon:yes gene_type:complete
MIYPLLAELNIDVPQSVIEAFLSLDAKHQVDRSKNERLKDYGKLTLSGPDYKDQAFFYPDAESAIIKQFISEHFNAFHTVAINYLGPESGIQQHSPHEWNVIVMPLHENNTIYKTNGEDMLFDKMGSCYFFNVEHWHSVYNPSKTETRKIAHFYIHTLWTESIFQNIKKAIYNPRF